MSPFLSLFLTVFLYSALTIFVSLSSSHSLQDELLNAMFRTESVLLVSMLQGLCLIILRHSFFFSHSFRLQYLSLSFSNSLSLSISFFLSWSLNESQNNGLKTIWGGFCGGGSRWSASLGVHTHVISPSRTRFLLHTNTHKHTQRHSTRSNMFMLATISWYNS